MGNGCFKSSHTVQVAPEGDVVPLELQETRPVLDHKTTDPESSSASPDDINPLNLTHIRRKSMSESVECPNVLVPKSALVHVKKKGSSWRERREEKRKSKELEKQKQEDPAVEEIIAKAHAEPEVNEVAAKPFIITGELDELVANDRGSHRITPKRPCTPSHSGRISWKKGELIGSGAFGKVYTGLNEDTGSIMAVKEISFSPNDMEDIETMRKEVELLRSLQHENIVAYLGTECTPNHTLLIFTEWVPGGSLQQLQKKFGGQFTENVVKKYTKQILQGLAYLHANHVIHRDIKSANILVDDRGTIKLTDFGASKRILGNTTVMNENDYSLRGTPYYMAPEVITQTGHGRKSDIWSVGCTVLQLLTGSPPWKGLQFNSPAALLYHIANAKEPPSIPATLSDEARAFILACFKRDTKERPTAKELLRHPFLDSGSSSTEFLSPESSYLQDKLLPSITRKNNCNVPPLPPSHPTNNRMLSEMSLSEQTALGPMHAITDRASASPTSVARTHVSNQVRSSSAEMYQNRENALESRTSFVEVKPTSSEEDLDERNELSSSLKRRNSSPTKKSYGGETLPPPIVTNQRNSRNSWSVKEEKPIGTDFARKQVQKELEQKKAKDIRKRVSQRRWEEELAAELAYQRDHPPATHAT